MNLIFIRQFTHYTKSQRLGILSLLMTIFVLQGIYFSGVLEPELEPVPQNIQQWLADTQEKDTLVKQNPASAGFCWTATARCASR